MSEKEFFRAVKYGDSETVKALLSQQPQLINARDAEQSTPLHWAAWKGNANVVEILLDAGADIQAHNENFHWGTTALHAAAHGNQTAAIEVLIRRGADVNAVRSSGEGTPLKETEAYKATAAAKLLIAAGAKK